MPRKTCNGSAACHMPWPGFNEAAARCRGKHEERTGPGPGRPASMRPRPDAAENDDPSLELLPAVRAASMRPRPDAAENDASKVCVTEHQSLQ